MQYASFATSGKGGRANRDEVAESTSVEEVKTVADDIRVRKRLPFARVDGPICHSPSLPHVNPLVLMVALQPIFHHEHTSSKNPAY